MGFKKLAETWHSRLIDLTVKPYEYAKNRMAQGIDDSSLIARLLTSGGGTLEDRSTERWAATSICVAGLETVSFFLIQYLFLITDCV